MIEKIIKLENISLIDFLGTENSTVKKISSAFPKCMIVSRGNELRLKGSSPDIVRINEIVNSLIAHYNKYGKITSENIETFLDKAEDQVQVYGDNETILFGTKGVPIKPITYNQKKLVALAREKDLIFAIGPAGTGKTYISVALAVRALKNKEVKRIIISRPAVEAGENLGFLPGDLKEKVDPYLRPIYDALDDMIPAEKLKHFLENRIIEIAPLAFMRGRTLSSAFVLLDEAQNTTAMQMKMLLTRLGKDSKMIITGDKSQIDLPRNQKSGLVEALRILKDIKDIGILELDGKDVVRHKLVRSIIEAYDASDKNNA